MSRGFSITGQPGFPPLPIGKPALQLDAPIQVRGDVSSQFLTALLMALPLVPMHESCPVTPVFSAGDPAVEAEQAKPNPFAVISRLKKN